MDRYRIDSHKLIYHVPRVNDWLAGKNIYPIYMEISPAGACNHRCTFCALDYMEYKPRFLEFDLLETRLQELGRLGVKSIMYAGEGEPFLHRRMPEIIRSTKNSGIDVALTTNAVPFTPAVAEKILGDVEWIKVSFNAGTAETYAKIHQTREEDFGRVIGNLSAAVEIRKRQGHRCTLGMQMLLLPENQHEVIVLAEIAREIGLDYLVVKPYSQHLMSKTREYESFNYTQMLHLSERLAEFRTDTFSVLFRANTMKKLVCGRTYERCHALPFWSYIDAGGNVWGCSAYLGDERFNYGNIREKGFKEIWEGNTRAESLHWVESELDAGLCRMNCRMDEINRYLWDLKHSVDHVNFI